MGRFLGVRNQAFLKHWSKISSKRPFGSILGGFGKDLGGFWEGLGRIFIDFWIDFVQIGVKI